MKEKQPYNSPFKFLRLFVYTRNYLVKNYSPKRILVYFIFVILSSFLWFYRTLEDDFVSNINYPVRYQNLPKSKILIGSPPEKIQLRVKGNGYSILSNKLKIKTPLNFNINNFLLYSQAEDSMRVYILTQYANKELTKELSKKTNDLQIISISPDTIFFSFTRSKSKQVPIKPSILNETNLCAQQYMVNGLITTIPDKIEVIGPATIIDTINFIYTKTINPTELRDTFRKKLDIQKIDRVEYSIKKAEVLIPVDKFTEISYEMPIFTRHVPDSINMKLFPRNTKINFNISLSNISKATDADFRPYVDFRDITANVKASSNRISIKIDSLPFYVHALRIYPSSVEFINELNNAQGRNNGWNR